MTRKYDIFSAADIVPGLNDDMKINFSWWFGESKTISGCSPNCRFWDPMTEVRKTLKSTFQNTAHVVRFKPETLCRSNSPLTETYKRLHHHIWESRRAAFLSYNLELQALNDGLNEDYRGFPRTLQNTGVFNFGVRGTSLAGASAFSWKCMIWAKSQGGSFQKKLRLNRETRKYSAWYWISSSPSFSLSVNLWKLATAWYFVQV